jgi:hypothetical protein
LQTGTRIDRVKGMSDYRINFFSFFYSLLSLLGMGQVELSKNL